jgi:hypothetical protein
MEQVVLRIAAALRTLDVSSIADTFGLCLFHSGCVLITDAGAHVLLEYMWGGLTDISPCSTYKTGSLRFVCHLTSSSISAFR